jgi:hypothetical protein
MDFGIVMAKVDEIAYISDMENLGYTHCWVTGGQMIRSNCRALSSGKRGIGTTGNGWSSTISQISVMGRFWYRLRKVK